MRLVRISRAPGARPPARGRAPRRCSPLIYASSVRHKYAACSLVVSSTVVTVSSVDRRGLCAPCASTCLCELCVKSVLGKRNQTGNLILDLRNAPWALTTRGSLTLSCFYRLSPTGGGEAGVPNPLSYTPSPFFAKVVSVALGGRSLPVVCRCAGGGGAARAHWRLSWMLAQAASVASRYAFGVRRRWRGCCAPGRLRRG